MRWHTQKNGQRKCKNWGIFSDIFCNFLTILGQNLIVLLTKQMFGRNENKNIAFKLKKFVYFWLKVKISQAWYFFDHFVFASCVQQRFLMKSAVFNHFWAINWPFIAASCLSGSKLNIIFLFFRQYLNNVEKISNPRKAENQLVFT